MIWHGNVLLPVPDGWEDASQLIVMGPPSSEFQASLNVTKSPIRPEEDIDAYSNSFTRQMKAVLSGYQLIQQVPFELGGLQGILREQTFSQGSHRISQLQFSCILGPVAYSFTYTTLAKRLESEREFALELLGSVRIEGASARGGGGTDDFG